MGSAQSYITSESAVTALVVAGAIGLGYSQIGAGAGAPASSAAAGSAIPASTESQDAAAKKGKKKKLAKTASAGHISETLSASKIQPQSPSSHAVAEIIPGQFDATPTTLSTASQDPALGKSKKSKKKAKGKAAGLGAETGASQAILSSESSVEARPPTNSKNAKRQQAPTSQPQSQQKQKEKQSLAPSTSTSSQDATLTRPLQQSTTSLDTDGSWTRVGSHRRVANKTAAVNTTDADSSALSAPTSDAGVSPIQSTSTEDDESPSFLLNVDLGASHNPRGSGDNRRTLAEKLLPKPRKTGVDDMLETSDFPTLSRVMRVQPLPNEKPADGFSWGDYEDVRVTTDGGENDADGEDDGGWGVVTSKRPKRPITSNSASGSTSSLPLKLSSSTQSEPQTKRQRQNAQKRESEKTAKADAEAERLARLAKHKRELEKAKITEQYSGRGGSVKGGKESGGMKATVDANGKLVWE